MPEGLRYAENDRPEKSPEIVRLIRSHGYRLFWHRPPLYSPDNFAGSTSNIFELRIVSFNMLCWATRFSSPATPRCWHDEAPRSF